MTDSWTADNLKASFLGITAHWIEVKDDRWKLHSAVIVFKGLSGAHTGKNLGIQFTRALKWVGILTANGHKVRSYSILL